MDERLRWLERRVQELSLPVEAIQYINALKRQFQGSSHGTTKVAFKILTVDDGIYYDWNDILSQASNTARYPLLFEGGRILDHSFLSAAMDREEIEVMYEGDMYEWYCADEFIPTPDGGEREV